jgi:hypothetical protein
VKIVHLFVIAKHLDSRQKIQAGLHRIVGIVPTKT